MTYTIEVYHQGRQIHEYDGYEATNALAAIDRLIADKFEDLLKPIFLFVSKDKPPISIDWTGLEFKARRLKMALS